MLSRMEVSRRARSIVPLLTGLPCVEAIQVLIAAGELVNRRSAMAGETGVLQPVPEPSADLLRRRQRGSPSKIDSDSEVRAFIHSLHGKHSYKRLAQLCLERFGQDRAPSKSSIHRYVAALREEKGVES